MGDPNVDRLAEHERDLAEERTRLARERTTLAHIRTGFASFLFGTALLGFFRHPAVEVAGVAFVVVGIGFLVTGWRSYVLSNRRTRDLLANVETPFRRE